MVMGSLRQETEVLVIGGGPGGYVAAIHAADLGLEVTLVEEREQLGGVCLIEGCIPSKALIHAVETAELAKAGADLGVVVDGVRFDLDRLRAFRDRVVGGLTRGVRSLLEGRGVEIVRARARFEGPRAVALEGGEVSGIDYRHCIVATGSRPVPLPFGEGVWTSREALAVPEVPERLLVVGGGYIGLELGFVYAGLGSRVTLVEMLPSLLATMDPDLVRPVAKAARARFEAVHVGARLVSLTPVGGGKTEAVIEGKAGERTVVEVDRVLSAVGRRPNTDDLGLERAGITPADDGRIAVDERMQAAPGIYAIGDIVPGPGLAHKASREGKVAAEVIAGKPAAFDNVTVPAVVFTDPEVASAGLTEAEARRQGRAVKVGRFPLSALGRARTMGRTDGVAKVVADAESGLLLGVGVAGPHASDLIAEAALAIEMGATLEDLTATIHPHPTLSEALMEAAEVAEGMPVHVLPPRKAAR